MDEIPTRAYVALFERADSTSAQATATNSNGCVVCSDTSPSCPTCADEEECYMTTQTCDSCPKTYCKAVASSSSSSSSNKTNIGGIVGGTIGGVAAFGILLFLFYKYYYQKKVAFNRVREHKEFFFDDDAEINFHHNRALEELEKPSQRTSIATTVFTRASNIIPIAYIPGVTIGPQGGSRSRAQSSRMSTLSETGTIDTEYSGDRFSKASIVGNPALTTTAIRARPKLVSVTEVKGPGSSTGQDGVPATAVGVQQLGGVRSVKVSKVPLGGTVIEEEEEEDDDDDVQSVVMKQEETNTVLAAKDDYEPFIIDDDGGNDDGDNDQRSVKSKESNGSVLLEVEIDHQSPFDDSFGTK